MLSPTHRRPSPALLVSVLALVAALAGTASALPGKNTVSRNDIKKNAVGGKQIAKDAVKSSDLADGKVKGKDLATGAVGPDQLADSEPFHRVGNTGEPPFYNGGEGDCVWGPSPIPVTGTNPASFYRDPLDVVHLVGAHAPANGAGGDGQCDPTDPGEAEDAILFVLPTGYRPENLEFQDFTLFPAMILPDEGAVVNGQTLEPGAVVSLLGPVVLDSTTFRAAGDATTPIEARKPARLGSLEELRSALR